MEKQDHPKPEPRASKIINPDIRSTFASYYVRKNGVWKPIDPCSLNEEQFKRIYKKFEKEYI
ncbi:MAG: hypothetical protein QXP53_00495 [Candidatus Pacearchaeota archaeon]